MTATNKRLLISKSRGDSNRYTPYRGKPDQHATRFLRLVRVWSRTVRISHGPHITTFRTFINRFEQIHCSREEGLPAQPSAQLSNPRVRTQLLSRTNNWSSGKKPSSYWHLTTRLTGPINTSMWLVRSILAHGANPSVLNWLRRGLPPWRCRFSHITLRSSQPVVFTFHLRTLPGLQFNQVLLTKPKCRV
jgi:hypothetical protein